MDEQATKLAREMLKHQVTDEDLLAYLPYLQLKTNIAELIKNSLLAVPALYDLKFKLIQNFSDKAFITSDAPVVLHNKMFESFSDFALHGYANVGLQIVLPLGPDRVLLFYDEEAYDVGLKQSNLIRLHNPAHVQIINDLQWESALHSLYSSTRTDAKEFLENADRCSLLRQKDKVLVESDAPQDTLSERQVRFVMTGRRSSVNLNLPFVRLRNSPPVIDPKHTLPIRHPEWILLFATNGPGLSL